MSCLTQNVNEPLRDKTLSGVSLGLRSVRIYDLSINFQ